MLPNSLHHTLPKSISDEEPEARRALFKIVRLDTLADVPGLIIWAYIETGRCRLLCPNGSTETFECDPGGFLILYRS